jgi:hypothetical protein
VGTSGAFGGSGGKDAEDLRDSLADWLSEAPDPGATTAPGDAESVKPSADPGPKDPTTPTLPVTSINLRPVIRILASGGGHGDGPGGGGGGGTRGGGSGGGRSGGGVRRSIGATSRAVGRAGALARAYASGDRASIERAGLNYDDLLGLGDMVAVGTKIVEAAFETQADSTMADDEAREIVASIVEWILECPAAQTPTPDEIVRRSIELMIADVTLTEVGDHIRAEPSREKRAGAEQEIRDAAEVYARQVTLTNTGASESEIAAAIKDGIRELGQIFGGRR